MKWVGAIVSGSSEITDQCSSGVAGGQQLKQMYVVERLTRQGNQIRYEVSVDDPETLVEPWVMTPRTLTLNPNPEAGLLPERGNCEVYETKNISSQIRH